MSVLFVAGARPQFVKVAPLLAAAGSAGLEAVLAHTGQHSEELSDPIFADLGIPQPDVELGIGPAPRLEQVGAMTRALVEVIRVEQPAWVVVVGDTTSTLAGALAARDAGVPLAHVEAGLRCGDREMPEEVNRVLTDRMADLLLCPSQVAAENLATEGMTDGVAVVGDVMRDAFDAAQRADLQTVAEGLDLVAGTYVFATVHRAANADDPARLAGILDGLGRGGKPVLFPAHPRTSASIERFGLSVPQNVRMVPPVGYLASIALARGAAVVVTDSGGVQKEAYWLSVPCVTLRLATEWVETVETGWNTLAGTDPDRIAASIDAAAPAHDHPDLYGDGHAAERCIALLVATAGRS